MSKVAVNLKGSVRWRYSILSFFVILPSSSYLPIPSITAIRESINEKFLILHFYDDRFIAAYR